MSNLRTMLKNNPEVTSLLCKHNGDCSYFTTGKHYAVTKAGNITDDQDDTWGLAHSEYGDTHPHVVWEPSEDKFFGVSKGFTTDELETLAEMVATKLLAKLKESL